MSFYKAKLHESRFRLWIHPTPIEGAYSAPPDPVAGFKGPTSKGREEREGQGGLQRGEEGSGKKQRGKRGENRPALFLST